MGIRVVNVIRASLLYLKYTNYVKFCYYSAIAGEIWYNFCKFLIIEEE